MARDVVSAFPGSADGFAGCGSNVFARVGHVFARIRVAKQFALAACEPETAVDDWGAEEPLRDEDPPQRHHRVSENCPDPAYAQSRA